MCMSVYDVPLYVRVCPYDVRVYVQPRPYNVRTMSVRCPYDAPAIRVMFVAAPRRYATTVPSKKYGTLYIHPCVIHVCTCPYMSVHACPYMSARTMSSTMSL